MCVGNNHDVVVVNAHILKNTNKGEFMRRYNNLYEKICDMGNLRKAYERAKKGKSWYKEVREIEKNVDFYLLKLREILLTHTYKTSNYSLFYKKEGEKVRKIYKLPFFPDRVAQWAIMLVIEPIMIKNFILDTYSAIPKRGIHFGLKRVEQAMNNDMENCQYCLKIDIKHYYQNINHAILKQKYRKLFKDKELLYILDEIIDSISTYEEEDLWLIYNNEEDVDRETGIPIGNYISQYSGNLYLSDFDHWIKEVKGVKHYHRQMDDILIFGKDKEQLSILLKEIKEYLKTNLKLYIKPNYQIFPSYQRGVDFLGYRTFLGYKLLRKNTCKKMKDKMTKIKDKCSKNFFMNFNEFCSIFSYCGWLIHCNSFRLVQKYIKPLMEHARLYYRKFIKKGGILV